MIDAAERESELPPFQSIGLCILNVVEQVEDAFSYAEGASGQYMGTGLPALDEKIVGIPHGEISLIVSDKFDERMMLSGACVLNAATVKSKKVAIICCTGSANLFVTHLLSLSSKIPVRSLRNGRLSESEWSFMVHSLALLNDAEIIVQNSWNGDILLINRLIIEQAKEPVGLVVIDGIDQLAIKESEMLSVLRAFKKFAGDFNVPIVATASAQFRLGGDLEHLSDFKAIPHWLTDIAFLIMIPQIVRDENSNDSWTINAFWPDKKSHNRLKVSISSLKFDFDFD